MEEYTPETPPQAREDLAGYVHRELMLISNSFRMVSEGRFLPILAVAPTRPGEGMLAIADGTNWNPGSGKGLYEYKSGTWTKL